MYKEVVGPALDFLDRHGILDSEDAHNLVKSGLHVAESHPLTLALLERFFAYRGIRFTDPRLKVCVGGLELESPVMVGAGWDKEGKCVRGLWQLGASTVTVGTVPEHPQYGNPRKRQFILAPGVALNRLGFNSPGMMAVDRNLERYQGSGIPIGVSLGKNKDVPVEDTSRAHAVVAKQLYHHAAYFEINVSSPNTPGLRQLQNKGPLTDIVQAVNQTMDEMGGRKPLAIKVVPDLTFQAVDDVIQVAIDNHVPIIIAANTTVNTDIKAKYGERWRSEAGGLSGDDPDFRRMSDRIIAHIFRQAGQQLDIIGVGGIKDDWTAMEKIMVGAKAVQVVTGLRGEGLSLPGSITRGLVNWINLRRDVKTINDFVGVSANHPTLMP
ncbi:MAG: Dihydroorotate dehydrogenase [Candidatus Daviesbacteria bacterium GW2011_GWA1_41_61]|uniref:Dihydroorotate dehydrogenase (quinone) n=1 Tax=Candidatus Daviesbacteria bacterium GW2011_GWA2_40_9 TaxID=1618424 RepID=A0A0G0X3K9_9BACT|nr:MAG: Dihydroorotate dehydrogenase [Candidatus Daviesbacteria bacterium GW2011_GWC1_40_9]KKR82187.1 MAG: Dihydroorotate dehydrogenase [Candidatus Daviesbacteria bacterium GW2011_GWA2_40_9]KKR93621.1 MAG: Dihydroorotate dehydrogenase [Candidatus Daviesbacteria bacterium GW2011_GWB1_41_15]KKS14828.1 MAG: Dihydroorotate dehydrogenase [Candidatus Daviesbacteria bacterium GW2011_GWA1_41_61]